MKKTFLCALLGVGASFAWAVTPSQPGSAKKSKPSARAVAPAEVSAKPEIAAIAKPMLAALPVDKVTAAAGFFGPVAKKYMPVYANLERDFLASTNKIATLSKYLPQAKKALEEARAMKVSPRFEAEKAEYIQMFETALCYAQAAIALSNLQGQSKPQVPKSR